MVIAEALQIGSHHFIFDEEPEEQEPEEQEPEEQEPEEQEPEEQEPEAALEPTELPQENITDELPEEADMYEAPVEIHMPERAGASKSYVGNQSYVKWSNEYREARSYLYGSEETEPDFERAFQLFRQEAKKGNALAMYDLARMFADGLGREADPNAAQDWYAKALAAFMEAELSAKERQKPYLQYRMGKLYAAGLGTEQDYGEAAEWFARAVRQNHKYAQYSLAGLYYRGQGVEQDYRQARNLYRCSAEQENPYASYELAKMYRDGIGTEPDVQKAATYFEWAFQGFLALEKKIHGDKLQYRLGQMLYTGTGTEKEETKAVEFWQKAARLGNANAQYALGKLYFCGRDVPRDREKAIPLLEAAAAQGNIYAQFLLDHLDSFQDPSVFLSATRLLHQLTKIFQEEERREGARHISVDRKMRRKIREKKVAQGHKGDDHEPQELLY